MFFRYIDFIFAPFRAIRNKVLGVQNIEGNIRVDINRAKSLGKRGKKAAENVNKRLGGGQQGQLPPGQQPAQPQPGYPQQGAPYQGAPAGYQQGYPQQQAYQQGAQRMQPG